MNRILVGVALLVGLLLGLAARQPLVAKGLLDVVTQEGNFGLVKSPHGCWIFMEERFNVALSPAPLEDCQGR
jgi:hypothetical protein